MSLEICELVPKSEENGPKFHTFQSGKCLAKNRTARLTLDLVVRWEKPNVRQWDASCVPVIELYCDEITIFLQIQGSCGMGEQKMGLGTNTRVQTPCKGSGDMKNDRRAGKHPISTFPRPRREGTEGSLCNGKSLIILNQPTQCEIPHQQHCSRT